MEFNTFRDELTEYIVNFCDCRIPSREAARKMWHDFLHTVYDDVTDWLECEDIIIEDYEPSKTINVDFETAEKKIMISNSFVGFSSMPVTIACDYPTPAPAPVKQWPAKVSRSQAKAETKTEVENTMSYAKTEEATKRDYLLGRISEIRYEKRDELNNLFNLYEKSTPRSYAELIEYIKEGKYELDAKRTKTIDASIEEHGIDYMGFSPFDGIKFTARPTADWDGYNAAYKELNKQIQSTKDTIMSGDYDKGLAAIQALEAWVPAGKAN